MFELKIANPELNDSTCSVSWCVDAETLKYLSDEGYTDPQVVIVVTPEGSRYHPFKEFRKVVSMRDLMTYVEFKCSGPNKIYGFISWTKDNGKVKDTYLSKSNGVYGSSVVNQDGSDYSYSYRTDVDEINKLLVSEPLSVVVPEGVFAPDPAQWEQDWVNHFFSEALTDQCHFRRRRLFAYTVQPVIMFFNILYRFVITLTALLIGAKNFSFRPLLHPLTESLSDTHEITSGGSIFIRTVKEDEMANWEPNASMFLWYVVRKFCLLPFMPVIAIPLGVLLYFKLWLWLTVIGETVAALLSCALVVFFIVGGTARMVWRRIKSLHNLLNLSKQDGTLWYLDQDEMDLLTCKPNKPAMDFGKLPSRKKTLRLRFQNLKSKVCRPYSS